MQQIKDVYVIDFEVYKHDWQLVAMHYPSRKVITFENDRDGFVNFINTNMETALWVGFNSKSYDIQILKAIYGGLDPYALSKWIIEERKSPYMFPGMKSVYFIPLMTFDTKNDTIKLDNFAMSLKEYEAYIGVDINEGPVDFRIQRPLTQEELDASMQYCIADVTNTMRLFEEPSQQNELLTQIQTVSTIDMPIWKTLHKTTAQLTAIALGAKKQSYLAADADYYDKPDVVNVKNNVINEFYAGKIDKGMKLTIKHGGLEYIFGLGGLHAAKSNYVSNEKHWLIDVASYYPSMMIVFDFVSRGIENPQVFKDMYDLRFKLKAEGNPMQAIYKRFLNTAYGAGNNEYNDLLDVRMTNNITITGQMLLFQLIEDLTPYVTMVQANTDGILVIPHDEDKIKEIVSKWEADTKLKMEYETYNKVIQSDVNNYIMVDDKGKVKVKGGAVKYYSKISNYKRHLRIVHKAIVDYLVYDIPVETTIKNVENILDYIYVAKATHLYSNVYSILGDGSKVEVQRVNRVLPSKDPLYGELSKFRVFKGKDSYNKFINAPKHAVIINQDITSVNTPELARELLDAIKVDWDYYIRLANKGIEKFLGKGWQNGAES